MQTIACTAAHCEQMAQDISTAQSDQNQSETNASAAKAALDAGIATGRKRMTGLREELTQLLGDDDDRWYAFGFNKPSDPETPETAGGFTLTAGAAGSRMAIAAWDDARRATSYRVRVRNVATNQLVLEQLTQDSELTLTLLPPGITIGVTIASRNAAGESPVTVELEVVVP